MQDQLAEGAIGIAEFLGDLLLGEAIDKDAAQGLVLPLGGATGLEEEVTVGVVCPGVGPGNVRSFPPQGAAVKTEGRIAR